MQDVDPWFRYGRRLHRNGTLTLDLRRFANNPSITYVAVFSREGPFPVTPLEFNFFTVDLGEAAFVVGPVEDERVSGACTEACPR